jgi:hypothetical protein
MRTADLHPGLAPVERALARVEPILPVETARARRQLVDTLTPITESIWPEISHRLSLLTNTGLPVEFSWSSRQSALRWTAEVAGPETPKDARLGIAAELAGVGTEWLAPIQDGRRLRYGAWLGARHHADRDELKVYAEVPAGAPTPAPADHPAFDGLELEWRIAAAASDGTIELYGRGEVGREVIDRCERAAFGTTGELPAAVARLAGTSDLPRPALFSVALDSRGGVDALTWYGFAERLFTDHEQSVAALEQWCTDDTRAQLLRALTAGTDDGRWRIGLVGAKLDATGSTSLQAAIRPS